MSSSHLTRRRGQASRATQRIGDDRLDRNMVVRCSGDLYEAARERARHQSISLSDYIRGLMIHDLSGQSRAPHDRTA